MMMDETFDQDFTWYEWTFVAPEEAPANEERTPEAETWTVPVVGKWGEEWVWTT
jgi:hypothetical protein